MRALPALFAICCVPAIAIAIPLNVSHSGYVLDASDNPLETDGIALRFRIFANATATGGESTAWDSGPCNLPVRAGYYATVLGNGCGTALDESALPPGATRWLEVEVAGAPLSPRVALVGNATAALAAESLDTRDLKARLARPDSVTNEDLVHFDKISNLPTGLADGDDDTKYTAQTGGGLALVSGAFALSGHSAAANGAIPAKGGTGGLEWLTVGSGLSVQNGALTATSAPTSSPTFTGTVTVNGTLAFAAGAAMTLPSVSSLPQTCTPGQLFYAPSLDAFYGCRAAGLVALGAQLGDAAAPASDCAAIRQSRPGATDGTYWITAGGGTAFQAVCDMSLDGGGWTRISTYDIPTNRQFTAANELSLQNVIGTAPAHSRVLVKLELDSSYGWVSFDRGSLQGADYQFSLASPLVQTTITSNARFGINTGTATATSTLWWNRWPSCYNTGSSSVYDIRNNVPSAYAFCFGQYGFATSTQTVLVYSAYATSETDAVGLGNRGTSHPDWTFAQNATSFTTRRLSWWVK